MVKIARILKRAIDFWVCSFRENGSNLGAFFSVIELLNSNQRLRVRGGD
ncbi:hypothetical protein RchiOBHm_Chr2g0169721 [Rosa chinensis]|uniref:Uncharacterized protein n=1 Tax=Rosa chinensis TaxID=74649 RepID=A0A2P6S4Z8_ROSCH|nr:hypothetical protein RchiOBHm_Chr2g0169721 [Rosa chinensis]